MQYGFTVPVNFDTKFTSRINNKKPLPPVMAEASMRPGLKIIEATSLKLYSNTQLERSPGCDLNRDVNCD